MNQAFLGSVNLVFAFQLLAALPAAAFTVQESTRASKIFEEHAKSVLVLLVRSDKGETIGTGTGFVVAGGKVITNEHVARGGNVAIDLGAAVISTKVERLDTVNDLAVLVPNAELAGSPLVLSDGLPVPGASVFVIGNPSGLDRTLSAGIVSAVREFDGRRLLQITAPISPGSSGGPVFDADGQVVGVTMGMLPDGQNLNFAVPATLVSQLLSGPPAVAGTTADLLQRAQTLTEKRLGIAFSTEPGSEWTQIDGQINAALRSALDTAGTDPDLLLMVANSAKTQSVDVVVAASEQAIKVRPSSEAHSLLAEALAEKAIFTEESAEKDAFLKRAETSARAALRLSRIPTAEDHLRLASILADRSAWIEANSTYRRALDLSKAAGDVGHTADSIRGLQRIAASQGNAAAEDLWFKALLETGRQTSFDWTQRANRQSEAGAYADAGASWVQAALLGSWSSWCKAATSYSAALKGQEENILSAARKCITEGSGRPGFESYLKAAHYQIASVLNDRGVYEEALSQAREADLTDAFDLYEEGRALAGLRRFQEVINVAKLAIRLSDGKYAFLHFQLGSAYFEIENWQLAKQSYETASELAPTDTAAPYNVAVCLTRLGYRRDAAKWYEEVLKRNPNYPDRAEVLARIQALRQ